MKNGTNWHKFVIFRRKLSLLGTFEGRVDPQGRFVVPQRFRDALAGGVVLAKGIDGCVEAYPPREWGDVSERVKQFSPYDQNARTLRRMTFSGAFTATLDRQGRTLLPQSLRQFADINEEVIITGQDNYFEIWSPEKWAHQEAQGSNLAEIAQSLESQREKGNG